jgi:hypothetical protein
MLQSVNPQVPSKTPIHDKLLITHKMLIRNESSTRYKAGLDQSSTHQKKMIAR